MMFLEDDRPSPIVVNHVSAMAGSWNGAADLLLADLLRQQVEHGQLISIDAHNRGPTEEAMFSAQYSHSLPGHGPLRLQFRGMLDAGLYQRKNPEFFFLEPIMFVVPLIQI